MRFLLLFLLAISTRALALELELPRDSRQAIVVSADGWKSTSGTLRCFARKSAREAWRPTTARIPVRLGRAGLAWGLGLHEVPSSGPRKIEGDLKVPAGVFRITSAFGYDEKPSGVALPYIRAVAGIEAVDDPHSRYYNRIVDRREIQRPDWRSSEKMRLKGEEYRLGLVVAHNPRAVPHAGSCIFLHHWKTPRTATSGCTAMSLEAIAQLQRWLRPEAKPVLMQAPREFIPPALREP